MSLLVPWYIIQVQLDKHESCIRIKDDQQLVFFPSAFDPIDCQLAKLALLNFCFPSLVKEENGNNFITILQDFVGHRSRYSIFTCTCTCIIKLEDRCRLLIIKYCQFINHILICEEHELVIMKPYN